MIKNGYLGNHVHKKLYLTMDSSLKEICGFSKGMWHKVRIKTVGIPNYSSLVDDSNQLIHNTFLLPYIWLTEYLNVWIYGER